MIALPVATPRRRLVLLACLLLLPRLVAQETAPIEGRWLGELTNSQGMTSAFGLDIQRKVDGGFAVGLYLEQMNYFPDRAPLGPLETKDGIHAIPSFALKNMVVTGDQLAGEHGAANRPFSMRRVAELPVESWPELPSGPEPKWQVSLGGRIWAPLVARDGIVYVSNDSGVLSAIKIADGSILWHFAAGKPIFGGALATEDAVLFACDNGFLFKISRADGKEIWRYDLGDAATSRILPHPGVFDYDHHGPTPVLADGTVFIGAGDGGFHAIDLANGERRWRHQAEGKIRTTAAVHADTIIYGTLGGEAAILDRASGTVRWKTENLGALTSSPVVTSELLLLGSRSSILRALRHADHSEAWRQGYWGSWVEATPVLADDGLAYMGTSDYRRVTCFDPADGRIVWRTDVLGTPWGAPALTPEFVYVAAGGITPYFIRHEGGLLALDRKTGRIAWRRPLPYPRGVFEWGYAVGPIVADGLLLAAGLDGVVSAFPLD